MVSAFVTVVSVLVLFLFVFPELRPFSPFENHDSGQTIPHQKVNAATKFRDNDSLGIITTLIL